MIFPLLKETIANGSEIDLPNEWDWRTRFNMSELKNQGLGIDEDWAYATINSLES